MYACTCYTTCMYEMNGGAIKMNAKCITKKDTHDFLHCILAHTFIINLSSFSTYWKVLMDKIG